MGHGAVKREDVKAREMRMVEDGNEAVVMRAIRSASK